MWEDPCSNASHAKNKFFCVFKYSNYNQKQLKLSKNLFLNISINIQITITYFQAKNCSGRNLCGYPKTANI
jgi:hypothetical protein